MCVQVGIMLIYQSSFHIYMQEDVELMQFGTLKMLLAQQIRSEAELQVILVVCEGCRKKIEIFVRMVNDRVFEQGSTERLLVQPSGAED